MPDEKEYIMETAIIFDQISSGHWFGNDWVGTHGFLFKILGAFLWMIFGKSVFILTLMHVFLAAATMVLLFRFAEFWFKDVLKSLCVCMLFFTGFYFQISLPSYLREIPVLFSFVLFLNVISKSRNYYIWGVCLLLILEAKEHVFFQILPGIIFGVAWHEFIIARAHGWGMLVASIIRQMGKLLIVPVLWVVMMLCTPLIPPNLYVIAILGLRDSNNSYYIDFKPQAATLNTATGGRNMPQINVNSLRQRLIQYLESFLTDKESVHDSLASEGKQGISLTHQSFIYFVKAALWILEGINILLLYLGKFAYPRTFSFVSIPLFIMIPVIYYVFSRMTKGGISRPDPQLIYHFIFCTFLLSYFLRLSHGRYLLAISPLIYIYFVELLFQKVVKKWVWAVVISLVFLGYYFEVSMAVPKLIMGLVLSLMVLFLHQFTFNASAYRALCVTFCMGFSSLAFLISLCASYVLEDGQLHQFKKWGYNYEVDIIMSHFEPGTPYWINSFLPLELAMKNPYMLNQLKNEYGIRPYVPKSRWMKNYEVLGDSYRHGFGWENSDEFYEKLVTHRIRHIGLLYSDVEGELFYRQEAVPELLGDERFILIKKINLKNKQLYIFEID